MKKDTIKGYKFINSEMKSKNGKISWEVGKWIKHKGKLDLCNSGFHACRTALKSLEYIYGDKWFIVEARGNFIEEEGDKFVASEMRLVKELPVDKIVKTFAIRCAKRCLKNYENKYPDDKRPAQAIQAAEDYVKGKITIKELRSAAADAWSVAESARYARSAAWSACSAAWSAWSACSVSACAWSACSAAESARYARSAAWSAEIRWQEKELNKIIKEILKKEAMI